MSVRIMIGDVREQLKLLPDESVHCVWTSIPYWGLRSYGTEPQLWGGEIGCEHEWGAEQRNGKRQDLKPSSETASLGRIGSGNNQGTEILTGGHLCIKCGVWRGEHGLEPSLEMWLANEVTIWRGIRRVLRKDGVAWLNCGDAYATSNNGRSAADTKLLGDDDRTFRDKPISTVGRAGKSGNLGNRGADFEGAPHRGRRITAGKDRKDVDVGGWGAADDSLRWRAVDGLKSKQRLMLPARVALALQGDGWWLRDEIVWHKANPMPSSVQDRTTPAHEMLYMLTRSARYYYDNVAIMEPMADSSVARLAQSSIDTQMGGAKQDAYELNGLNTKSGSRRPNEIVRALAKKTKNEQSDGPLTSAGASPRAGFNARWDAKEAHRRLNNQDEKLVAGEKWGARHEGWKATQADRVGRNKRSVWPLATEPFPDAHFATAPTALVEPCIRAGTSEKGCCPKCGAPWWRIVDKDFVPQPDVNGADGVRGVGDQKPMDDSNGWNGFPRGSTISITAGWRPGCSCNAGDPVPCTVLEPFLGSGTTALVADRLGRNCIGIDLNPEYVAMARARVQDDAGMFAVIT